MKNKRSKKGNILKRIYRIIKGLLLLGTVATSLAYIIYILGVATITYLSNRPIRTAVLFGVVGLLMMAVDTMQDNKRQAEQTRQARARQQARARARVEQNNDRA